MHRFLKMFGLTCLFVLATYVFTTAPAQSRDDRGTGSWQHLALTADQDGLNVGSKINELGREGWELVDVEMFNSGGDTVKTIYYFKRPG